MSGGSHRYMVDHFGDDSETDNPLQLTTPCNWQSTACIFISRFYSPHYNKLFNTTVKDMHSSGRCSPLENGLFNTKVKMTRIQAS